MKHCFALFIIWIIFAFMTTSCANTSEKYLAQITVGMDKAMVLDLVGDPKSTDRINSTDEWLYPYHSDGQKKYKKVYFKYGKVFEVKHYDPSDEDISGSYEEYTKKIKVHRKQKDKKFKDIGQ